MKEEDFIIIKENDACIGWEGYIEIARALINVYGADICKLIVKGFQSEEDRGK